MIRSIAAALVVLSSWACGGGGGNPGGPSPPPQTNPNVITIGSNGVVSPRDITVAPGSRVLVVNQDGRRHDMTSDPHPEHDDCPAITQGGLLTPGQSRETGNMNTIRTCGFHDHEDSDNNNLKGRIITR